MSYTVKDALNDANPNNIADLLRVVNIGDVLGFFAGQNAIEDEVLDITSHVHTLVEPAFAVQGVHVSAGNVTGGYLTVAAGATPASGEVALNLTAGTLTFLAADNVSAGTVSYVTQPVDLSSMLATDWNA